MESRKCRKCFQHEKKNIPYKGHKHECPYRYCNCADCEKLSLLCTKKHGPQPTFAPYQQSMMARIQNAQQEGFLVAAGYPQFPMSSSAPIYRSPMNYTHISAGQAPLPIAAGQAPLPIAAGQAPLPIAAGQAPLPIAAEPATSQFAHSSFVHLADTQNVSGLHTYGINEGMRNMYPRMSNTASYQNRMASANPGYRFASYLPTNYSEIYSKSTNQLEMPSSVPSSMFHAHLMDRPEMPSSVSSSMIHWHPMNRLKMPSPVPSSMIRGYPMNQLEMPYSVPSSMIHGHPMTQLEMPSSVPSSMIRSHPKNRTEMPPTPSSSITCSSRINSIEMPSTSF